MFTQLKKLLMIFIVCSLLAFSSPISAFAQDEIVSDQFTFLQLGQSEITLLGPHDSRTFTFGLPADWKLEGGGTLDLLMTVSFSLPKNNLPDNDLLDNLDNVATGGILTVEFNDNVISVFPVDQTGQIQEQLLIPVEAMQSTRGDGRMKLDFVLDSGLSCYFNQQMTVIIHAGSMFTFPHDTVMPDTALVNFPRPLYQASIIQDSVLFVVPDRPSSAELRGALTVAAGLGNLTSSQMLMDLVAVGELTPAQVADNDLILVGKANTMPLLSDLTIPAEVASGKFRDTNEDDGVIQMVNSPWNPANVVLMVGGNTDVGVVKAAQAVSTGALRAGAKSNLSIVETVQPTQINPSLAVYQSLADLGHGDNQLTRYGTNTTSYAFYIPPGTSISADAYFELAYTHSALVDFNRSGIVLSMNNRPIGSVRFTETSASNSTNRLRVSIPPSTIIPGNNLLSVSVNLLPLNICSDPRSQGLWAMIWSDSYINLPLGIFPAETVSLMSLDTYPGPFSFNSTLSDSAFVLQKDNPDAWRAALHIASFLGDRAGVALTTLGAFYADDVPAEERANYNMLVFGQPSQLPLIAELNDILPAPFIDGGDIASQAKMQVTFRVPPSSPVGYLQMVASPWNPDKVVLTVVGNSTAGIRWAEDALVEPTLRSGLAGNFALVEGNQILTADTRMLASTLATIPSPVPNQPGSVGETIDVTPPTPVRPTWILPTIIISISAVVLVLLSLAFGGRRNHRPKATPKES